MIGYENDSFRSAELSKLRPGNVELKVPLVNGIIQVHSVPIDKHVPLFVKISESGIFIKRRKSKPIQIEVIMPVGHDPYTGTPVHETYTVFEEPVTDFTFVRGPRAELWTPVGNDVVIVNTPAIKEFAKVLGNAAINKQ
jgi:hypothetical protein